ncbi:MAG TPA: hypothetical protein VG370_02275 [Chloroflexota bacterium]|nr:hypothetical protein [Chloroflexota bacterium]
MDRTGRTTVVGVFGNRDQADRAVEELRRVGFRDDQIGYAMRGADGETVATETGGTAAGEGLATGAVIGGLVGAAAALLIPGIGPVVAGGVLASVLGGAAVGAAAGGILGALVGMGIPEEEASYYESEFQAGRVLVTVKCEQRCAQAQEVMRRFGAYDVETRGTTAGATSYGTTTGASAYGTAVMGTDTVRREEAVISREGQVIFASFKTWDEAMPHFRNRWQQRWGSNAQEHWEDWEPRYRFGWEMANRPEYRGRSWNDVESQWQKDWEMNHRGTPWDKVKEGVRDAWEWVTGTQVRR